MTSVRAVGPDDWSEWRALRLRALTEAPHAFGSTVADWSGAGDTEARWRGRLEAVPLNLVADVGGEPVGMLSVTAPDGVEAELISMWVAPSARGRGVGAALVAAAVDHARRQGTQRVVLSVRVDNRHAIDLYARSGFVDGGWATGPDDPHPERRMVLELRP